MEPYLAFVTGILSSLFAVAFIEIYKFSKNRIVLYKLKAVLGIKTGRTRIIAPLKLNEGTHRISHRDAYAFGYLFDLCNKISKDIEFIPFNKISENAELYDSFSVGGPLSNDITKAALLKYFPGFSLVVEKNSSPEEPKGVPTTPEKLESVIGFKIGEKEYKIDDQDEYAVLAKISNKASKQPRTIHLCYGLTGRGTGAAAYFLWKNFKKIYQINKDSSYFILVKFARGESYKHIYDDWKDLTASASNNTILE